MNKNRILLIGPVPPPAGGIAVHLNRLLHRSHELADLDVALIDLRKLKLFMSDGSTKGPFSAFAFFIKAPIVHIHLSHRIKTVIGKICKLFGKKIIYTQHNLWELNTSSTKKMMKTADKIVFVFNHEKLPPNGIVIPAYIHSEDDRALPGFLTDKLKGFERILLSLSSESGKSDSMEDKYGFDLILDSLRIINISRQTLLVLIDTNGKLMARYEKNLPEIEEESGVSILFIPHDVNFQKMLEHTTVFIRATRTDGDAVSVREALHRGIHTIASDCIKRPEGCRLFRNGDLRELAIAIDEVETNNPPAIFIQEDFSKKIFALYRELL